MSILINGMGMPDYGYVCLKVFANGEVQMTKVHRGALVITGIKDKVGTAVTVPPHGRLIDEKWLKEAMITTLESLKKNPKMDRQEMHLLAAFDTLRVMVEDAPTIIPASFENLPKSKDSQKIGKGEL